MNPSTNSRVTICRYRVREERGQEEGELNHAKKKKNKQKWTKCSSSNGQYITN